MVKDPIVMRDAIIINRNFEGRPEKPYNPQGKRNFTLVIDNEEFAHILKDDGWNVKIKESSDPDEPAVGYLSVTVKFDGKNPPKVIQVTNRNGKQKMTPLNEHNISLLDSASIRDVKVEIVPYNWEMKNPKDGTIDRGVRAYLRTMYFELIEDCFAADYYKEDEEDSDIPFDEV